MIYRIRHQVLNGFSSWIITPGLSWMKYPKVVHLNNGYWLLENNVLSLPMPIDKYFIVSQHFASFSTYVSIICYHTMMSENDILDIFL